MSEELKAKIAEARSRNDMPLDSAHGTFMKTVTNSSRSRDLQRFAKIPALSHRWLRALGLIVSPTETERLNAFPLGAQHGLQAVDQDGYILDEIVQTRRDTRYRSACSRLLKRQRRRRMITDVASPPEPIRAADIASQRTLVS
jgi:hypothetical protein